jgi:hypothetical protein
MDLFSVSWELCCDTLNKLVSTYLSADSSQIVFDNKYFILSLKLIYVRWRLKIIIQGVQSETQLNWKHMFISKLQKLFNVLAIKVCTYCTRPIMLSNT